MAKRANKEGTISKRSDGRWEIKYYDVDGKRRTAYAKTQALARDKLKELHQLVDSGIDVSQINVKFIDWMQTWLETYANPTVQLSTYGSYHTYIHKHIIPHFPKATLKDLKAEQLQKFLNSKLIDGRLDDKPGGLSSNTVRKIKVMVGTALKQAVNNDMVNRNVADMVKLPEINQLEMRVLSLDEQNTLEKTCLSSNDLSAFAVYLALNTGMRLGELVGLQWQHVDLENGIIHVRKTLNRLKTPAGDKKTAIVIGKPKSKCSRRDIPMFADCVEKLQAYRNRQQEYIASLNGSYDDRDFVFATPIGRYIEPKTFQDLFKRQIKVSGIKDANVHSTRHTFATRSLEAGMDIMVLSRILGHAQPSTTLNKYGHALPDHKRTSMGKLEEYRRKTTI